MRTKPTISKSAQQDKELSELRKENRKLRSKVKQLELGKATLKEQLAQFKVKFAEQQQQAASALCLSEHIARHQYSELLISMCVNMYVVGGCGLRGVVRLLSYFNTTLQWGLTKLPSKSAVETWVLKAGYHLYKTAEERSGKQEYGIIVDECMVVGQERMLAALCVPAQKVGSEAICAQDVEVVHLKVKPSWDGDAIKESVVAITEKMGRLPAYVVSDGSSNLVSGFEKAHLKRVADVGHQLALFTEQGYKNDAEFMAFSTAMAQCKLKEVMKPAAYLLPPKQRVIARFMNLSVCVKWAEKMLAIQSCLNEEEQQAYSFVSRHRPIIGELSTVFGMLNTMLSVLKKKGLCYSTISTCLATCYACTTKGASRIKQLMDKIKAYLRAEKAKLPNKQSVWHNSSDIIESLFGFYKSRKASNALHGVTAFVLTLPLLTKTSSDRVNINLNFREALQSVYMKDIKQWGIKYLIENQVVKRTVTFKNKMPVT